MRSDFRLHTISKSSLEIIQQNRPFCDVVLRNICLFVSEVSLSP